MTAHLWHELSTIDFARFDPATTVAIMPVGSTEQHGPHLPLMVDAFLPETIARHAAAALDDTLSILILPTLSIGKSNEHNSFTGTLSLSATTLISLWTEVGASVARSGIKKLLILNGHGGQSAVAKIVARELRIGHDMLVVPMEWWSLGRPDNLFSAEELTHGIHGGEEETSAMLYLRPDLVNLRRVKNFTSSTSELAGDFPLLCGEGARFAWKMEDLNSEGACGNAANADAEKGKLSIDAAVSSVSEILQEMSRFQWK